MGSTALSNADLYTTLSQPIGNTLESCGGKTLVVPGDPFTSFLLTKLGSDTPGCGTRMPRGNGNCSDNNPGACLTGEQMQTIATWIAGGALHN